MGTKLKSVTVALATFIDGFNSLQFHFKLTLKMPS